MKVKDILPLVKANKYTYYNLNRKSVIMFKDLYSYLKKYKYKEIGENVFQNNDALKGQIEFWLNNKNETEYIRKYKTMELISDNIKHYL